MIRQFPQGFNFILVLWLTASNDLTIATACRNREENLRRALESWLNLCPAQIIVCDWGSTIPITHERLGVEMHRDKILILRHEANSWILTWAFNEALCKVETKFVLKLDCDHVVSYDFLEKNPIDSGHFSRGHWRNADKGQEYINGAFLSCSTLLKDVGYYDERLTTYGWDDSDLYERLYDACLGSSIFAKGCLTHLEQCETTRTKEQEVSKETILADTLGINKTAFLINRNRLLAGMLWPWDSDMYQNRESIRVRFIKPEPEEETLIEYATQSAFKIHYQWLNLIDETGIPAGEAYLRALYTFEQKTCYAPISLSISRLLKRYSEAVHANDESEINLIRIALLANSEQSRLKSRIKPIESINRITSSAYINSLPEATHRAKGETYPLNYERPKLYIDAQHGLGNRMRSIASAAAIAKSEEYELVIIWEPDEHCNCHFHDLFEYSGPVIDSSFRNINKDNIHFYNYMEIEGGRKDEPIECNSLKSIYVRSAFTLCHPSSEWDRENEFLQALTPIQKIRELVSSAKNNNDISVHIRMGEVNAGNAPSYEKNETNWSIDDQKLIDHWRSKSNCASFISKINLLAEKNPRLEFFLASDNQEAYDEMARVFGSRVNYLRERALIEQKTKFNMHWQT